MWKISAYPIPISSAKTIGNNNHTTLMTGFSENFGQSLDGFWYIEIPNTVHDSCTADETLTFSEIMPIKDIAQDLCSLGLYLNSVNMIQTHCSPKILLNSGVQHKILPIQNDKLLIITDSPSFMLLCHNKPPAEIPLTSYMTIVSRPCECSIKSMTFFLPTSLVNCDLTLNINTAKIMHAINLPILWAFHRHAYESFQVSSDSLFDKEWHIVLPNIITQLAQLDDFDGDLDSKLSLDRTMISQKFNGTKLQTINLNVNVYKFLHSTGLKTFNYYLTFINTILIMLEYVLLFYLACRYGVFTVLVAQHMPVASARYVTFPPPQLAATSSSINNITLSLTMNVMPTCAFIFVVYKSSIYIYTILGFIYNLAKTLQQLLVHGLIPNNCKNNLILKFCTPDHYVPIKIFTFLHTPKVVKIISTEGLRNAQVSDSFFFPKLILKWENTQVSILHNDPKPFQLPKQVSLTYWKGKIIKTMLQMDYATSIPNTDTSVNNTDTDVD